MTGHPAGATSTVRLFNFLFNDIMKRWYMGCKRCNRVDEEPGLPSRARQGHRQGGLVSQQQGAQESREAFLDRNGRLDRSVAIGSAPGLRA